MSLFSHIGFFGALRGPRLLGGLTAAVLFVVDPGIGAAQDDFSPDISGIKLVVPQVRGKKSWGRDPLTRSLRENIRDGVDLLNHEDFRSQQKELRLRGKAAYRAQNLAKAGQAIGADFVLYVRITRQRWLYTATALLIDTESGAEKMNFRSQYYKPKEEAEDRGFRIARRTLQKLVTLMEAGEILTPDDPPVERPGSEPLAFIPPADSANAGEAQTEAAPSTFDNAPFERVDDVETPATPDLGPETLGPEMGLEDQGVDHLAQADPELAAAPLARAGSGLGQVESTSLSSESPATVVSQPPARGAHSIEVLRISVGAGAGFVRTYDVGSDAVAESRLSHTLSPMGLFSADIEITVPEVPFFGRVSSSLRPVNYSLDVQNSVPVEGSGILLNLSGLFGYQIGINGNDRSSIRLMPAAGVRFAMASAAAEINDVVLSSDSLAVVAGMMLRWPINDRLEINVGLDGGYVFSYSEDPTTTGDNGAGFVVGADLGAQIWLTDSIGVMIDNRFVVESVSLDGTPTRAVRTSERDGLTNASVTTRDLFTSVGVVFRL